MNSKYLNALIICVLLAGVRAKAHSSESMNNASESGMDQRSLDQAAQVISNMMRAGILVQDGSGAIKIEESFKDQLMRNGRFQTLLAGPGSICN